MNEMNAGLAAIAPGATTQAADSKTGMPRQSMEQMMSLARKLSDAQLADVLAGKSMEVPQFVAMSEAMGRKQLRTAMQGAQARQQQRASVKDQMLAEAGMAPQQLGQPVNNRLPEEQGIGALPAPT